MNIHIHTYQVSISGSMQSSLRVPAAGLPPLPAAPAQLLLRLRRQQCAKSLRRSLRITSSEASGRMVSAQSAATASDPASDLPQLLPLDGAHPPTFDCQATRDIRIRPTEPINVHKVFRAGKIVQTTTRWRTPSNHTPTGSCAAASCLDATPSWSRLECGKDRA